MTRTVYVIDDDQDLRHSLQVLLSTRQISVVAFGSGLEFLDDVSSLLPAPIILDVRMPQMDGIQILRELDARQVDWPTIMLTGHGEIRVAVDALKAGAVDFLEKPVSSEVLMTALEIAFDLVAKQDGMEAMTEMAATPFACLTPREREVLDQLCTGRSNKQAAYILSLSPRTVEMHRANALRRLKVRTLVEAAALRNPLKPNHFRNSH